MYLCGVRSEIGPDVNSEFFYASPAYIMDGPDGGPEFPKK
jgi:hypothetical protein